MSSAREILPVLIGFEREGDSLSVMVDTDPESAEPNAASILTLRFKGCAATAEARADLDKTINALTSSEGKPFEWDVTESEAEFYIDYDAAEASIVFSSHTETAEAPSIEMVHQRVAVLATWADELSGQVWKLNRRHTSLKQALEHEANREADRAARKLPFLRKQGSASAIAVEARATAFERVRKIIHESKHSPR